MDTFGFAVIAAGVILFSLVSRRLQASIITGPMVFAGFGLLIGTGGLNLVDLHFGHGFIHGLAELTLILVLFTDATRIDLRQVRRDHDLPLRLLLIGMPLTIVLGTVVALLLPLGLAFWEAALLAAILAPTDAALGQAVVSNARVPVRIRQALNIESGLNDGIALPLVLLFACLAIEFHAGGNEQNWVLFGAKQILLGPLAGLIVGGLGAWMIDRAVSSGWMSKVFEGPAILGVALLAFAGAELIEGNGFIAAFTAGIVFGNQVRGRCDFLFEFAESEGQLLTLLTFMVFGAAILPDAFAAMNWWIAFYAILSLTVIRMLPVTVSLFGSGVKAPTVLFLGWFGPRGLASFLFALLVLEEAAPAAQGTILTVTVTTVIASIVLHGLTAAPGAQRYATAMQKTDASAEAKPVSEMPTRAGIATGKRT